MEIRQLTEDYSVAGQIGLEHIPLIKGAGYKAIVSNRPDTEEGAIPHDEIASAAREAGLEFRYLPVVSGQITDENVRDQAAALKELPKPVLAYCRSGTRCTNLHSLIREQGL